MVIVWTPYLRYSAHRLFKRRVNTTGFRKMATGFENLKFTNNHIQDIAVDPDASDSYRQVQGYGYISAQTTPLKAPKLVAVSHHALKQLGVELRELEGSPAFLKYASGEEPPDGSRPVAHAYCGHQYGFFSGQLGDGAALTLGVIENKDGIFEIQMKGTGRTAFSRPGTDGRKVLRSSIREFLCSEAMHHLGIPTTRAVSCVTSSTKVSRDIHYTGIKLEESAAVVMRIAPSFLRVGSLEVCLADSLDRIVPAPSPGDIGLMKSILNYVMKKFYPQIACHTEDNTQYVEFYEQLVLKSAALVAQWQTVGFCHGVLNTDNISLLGLTMDYGPFAFMETFDTDHISNSSDFWARYTYQEQPNAMKWALQKLAETMGPVVRHDVLLEKLDRFDIEYRNTFLHLMREKLGLATSQEDDSVLVEEFFRTMYLTGADMTTTFRTLSSAESMDTLHNQIIGGCSSSAHFREKYAIQAHATDKDFLLSQTVLGRYPQLLEPYREASRKAIDRLNKRDIVGYAQGLNDGEKFEKDKKLWSSWLQKYEARISMEPHISREERRTTMKKHNPRIVPKNRVLQNAIKAAEGGDYRHVRVLLGMLESPFVDDPAIQFADKPDLHGIAKMLLDVHDSKPNASGVKIT